MNWHYANPVVDGDYLCCVKNHSFPMPLTWYDGEWGNWDMSRGNGWHPIDNATVVCYLSFHEIPMPEGW